MKVQAGAASPARLSLPVFAGAVWHWCWRPCELCKYALLHLGLIVHGIKMQLLKKGNWNWQKPAIDTPFLYPLGCCDRCIQPIIPVCPDEVIS